MRLLLLFLLIGCTFRAVAQEPDTTAHLWCPNTFYTDYYEPYITWIEKPTAFSFVVYDRWGEQVFTENRNPDFHFGEAKEHTFHEDVYLMKLSYTLSNGKSYTRSWQAFYVGFYCAG